MISEEAAWTASHCRHYAMCKIDFLGTGLCPSGPAHHYVSYYPQGRMDLCSALARDLLPLTPALVDIANTCTLCGICDRQCHFVTGMRPTSAMKALKTQVAEWLKEGRTVETVRGDAVINRLKDIVGEAWAANDPAILLTYADDPFPLKERQMPAYVVLPSSREELVNIIKLANEYNLSFTVRGNGGSVFGIVFSDGLVIDMNRMKSVRIDKENWVAIAEAGATAFEVQSEAYKYGFRVNAAEPAATACGNIFCTGLFSTWSNAYGVGADNLVNAELVDHQGKVFALADPGAPN
ncbi:MAG TPA: FAD-dependent oxidoreductase, partial [Thermodesulfobacteriota bacterium]|nr:FAD-dependent oxidoreductase [Thermodesulfobacteriota bacterium]